MSRAGFIQRTVAAVCVGVCASFALATASGQLITTRKDVERQSRVMWLEMKRQLPLAPNPAIQRYVECVAYSIIEVLPDEHQGLDWEIQVFDSDELNAFATLGGKIGVFTGMLELADTPDMLAVVLGHEIAHLTENHVFERSRRGTLAEAASIIGGAATGMHREAREGASALLFLPFSRGQESEADQVGLLYTARAGYNPIASLDLWKRMISANENRPSPPEFLSSHPSDDRRIDELARSLRPALIEYNKALEAGTVPACGRR